MSTPQTPEQLLATFAPTPQNRTAAAVIERRIDMLRDQLESCSAEQLPHHQGGIAALRSLHRLIVGLPE